MRTFRIEFPDSNIGLGQVRISRRYSYPDIRLERQHTIEESITGQGLWAVLDLKVAKGSRTMERVVMKPQLGEMAPDFTAAVVGSEDRESVTLSDLRGQRVVLVFYPKDDTPGCTTQACELRDGWAELKERAAVFGVSVDDVKSHLKFIKKHSLPYPLISDPEKTIVEAYGVWVEKSMYGKTFMGTERSTFVIGPDGRIERIFEKVAPKDHLRLLNEALG